MVRFSLGVAYVGSTVGFTLNEVAVGLFFSVHFACLLVVKNSNEPHFSCVIGVWQNRLI